MYFSKQIVYTILRKSNYSVYSDYYPRKYNKKETRVGADKHV